MDDCISTVNGQTKPHVNYLNSIIILRTGNPVFEKMIKEYMRKYNFVADDMVGVVGFQRNWCAKNGQLIKRYRRLGMHQLEAKRNTTWKALYAGHHSVAFHNYVECVKDLIHCTKTLLKNKEDPKWTRRDSFNARVQDLELINDYILGGLNDKPRI